jgi:vitamin B12 transporter
MACLPQCTTSPTIDPSTSFLLFKKSAVVLLQGCLWSGGNSDGADGGDRDSLEEPVSDVPASVTVITEEEITRKGAVMVEEVIRDVPGVYVRRFGTVGASTSVRIRGADATQTLVLIDGVAVSNSWTGFYDFGNLTVGNVERIEIVRNTQSALYGSEAMGGVINIITKRGEGTPGATL